jgi:hypothetical protein
VPTDALASLAAFNETIPASGFCYLSINTTDNATAGVWVR